MTSAVTTLSTRKSSRPLSAEQLLRLHRLGLLGPVYFLISSLGNFQRLVNLKIARLQSV